ncbi:MAG TPA: TIGR03668 family PPOX class F420-dependent oxidoreductase [Chloroflexota bacterium]|nr:TIGR03668 family PPOX class F420-dependent oxidoreductase [Chloroflexota bacterium]
MSQCLRPVLSADAWQKLAAYRVARLGTVDPRGRPQVIPICFAVDGSAIYSALDEKPKRVQARDLSRVRNLLAHPEVTVTVDDYSEDWTKLSYLMVHGVADLLGVGTALHNDAVRLLRAKYPQYGKMAIERQPVIRVTPTSCHAWSSAPGPGTLDQARR